jgi:hypothetical protein
MVESRWATKKPRSRGSGVACFPVSPGASDGINNNNDDNPAHSLRHANAAANQRCSGCVGHCQSACVPVQYIPHECNRRAGKVNRRLILNQPWGCVGVVVQRWASVA